MNLLKNINFNQISWYFSGITDLTTFFVFGYLTLKIVPALNGQKFIPLLIASVAIAIFMWVAISSLFSLKLKYNKVKGEVKK